MCCDHLLHHTRYAHFYVRCDLRGPPDPVQALKKDVLLEDNDLECALAERSVLMKTCRHPFLTALHSCFQVGEADGCGGEREKERSYFVPKCFGHGELYGEEIYVQLSSAWEDFLVWYRVVGCVYVGGGVV